MKPKIKSRQIKLEPCRSNKRKAFIFSRWDVLAVWYSLWEMIGIQLRKTESFKKHSTFVKLVQDFTKRKWWDIIFSWFYQLNNHLKRKMCSLWVCNIPVKYEDKRVKYMKWHIFELREKDLIYDRHKGEVLSHIKVIPQYCIAYPYCTRFLRH